MRLAYMGTPGFAVPALERLLERGHEVAAVFTQPDRPSGRGQQLAAPPVKEAALRLGLPVHQPLKIRTPEFRELLRGLDARAFIVVGYGRIIPQSVIDIPPLGILNVHASLLPKYRGAAPIQWAVASGEARTGVTIMRIDAGLDTGDMLLKAETDIGPEETALELGPRLAAMGADLLIEALDGLERGAITPQPQDHTQASLAPVLKKEDGLLDWSRPAAELHNRIRGLLPWPGCFTNFRGQMLRVWKARVVPAQDAPAGAPGQLRPRKNRIMVSCGESSALELLEVQLEGKRRMDPAAFLNGQRVKDNEVVGNVMP